MENIEARSSLELTNDMKQLAEERAEIYRIFSNAKRLLIFWLLNEEEMPVNKIAESIDSSIQNTSQHLRLMKANKILETRRNGKEIYYRISDSEIGEFCKNIHLQHLSE
jgi:DNA-binding transcriptional ArsR family regulator